MVGVGSNSDILNVSYIKVCGMESLRTSGNVYFSHVSSWKIGILINLGYIIFKNDKKI
jgi:hypothetical protein